MVLAFGQMACRKPERQPKPAPVPKPALAVEQLWPAGELRSGGTRPEASLVPGEIHRYRLSLAKGTFLRLLVEQRGVDLAVQLEDPAGALVLKADRRINDLGPELVLAVAGTGGDYHLTVSAPPDAEAGRYAARIETLRPAAENDRRSAEAYRLLTGARALDATDPPEAERRRRRALALWRELGDAALQAEALERLAFPRFDRLEYRAAADLLRQAVTGFVQAEDRRREAIARIELVSCLLPLGEVQETVDQMVLALPLARQAEDPLNQAKALQALGQAYQLQGELQKALDLYGEALTLWPKDDRRLRPTTLHNLGVLYARSLRDPARGAGLLEQARDAWLPVDDRSSASTRSQLGRLYAEQGRFSEARQSYGEALHLLGGGDSCQGAVILAGLARMEQVRGAISAAESYLARAFHLLETHACPTSEPLVQLVAAGLAERKGESAAARERYRRGEALYAQQGDRLGRAESLAGLARSERALGDRAAALAASRRGLAILEGVRPTVLSDDLRASFFSGARSAFDFQIDLLLEMGKGEEAWAAAERARARVLGDLLAESGAGVRGEAPPELLAKEGAVRRQLNVLESRRLGTPESEAGKLRALRREIGGLVADLETVRGELRRRSPRYASLVQPEPLSFAVAQRDLLDGETVLLEYRLAEPASTLWVASREGLTVARLPGRGRIERLAGQVKSQMAGGEWPGHFEPELCELSRMLLSPAAARLGRRRLVVVADGALEGLPFAALPDLSGSSDGAGSAEASGRVDPKACRAARYWVEGHEIVYLPSAATLLTQRRRLAGRRPAPGWLAVVADPVYDLDDDRLPGAAALRSGTLEKPQTFHRLPGAGEEAAEITAGLPGGKVRVEKGFAASRTSVLGGALQGFQILHFATHASLDAEQPLLSALALSQLDAARRPVAGILPAHEIYDLDLPAELVVLSACETARGKEVPGEGLVSGLPRAFLYAGAARVVVSVWKVPDRATQQLMTAFYRGLFVQGLSPARALQEAQKAMALAGKDPLDWAGFVLVGDWRPLPPFRS